MKYIYAKDLTFTSLLICIKNLKSFNLTFYYINSISLLVKISAYIFNLNINKYDYDLGKRKLDANNQFHLWSYLEVKCNEISEEIYNKYKNQINYYTYISKKLNDYKYSLVIRKDIEIDIFDEVLLYLLAKSHIKKKEKTISKIFILNDSFFSKEINNYFSNYNIKFIKTTKFIILKYLLRFIIFFIINIINFIPSLMLKYLRRKMAPKIASKFELGILKKNFRDFYWINNFEKYKNKLIFFFDEKLEQNKFKIIRQNNSCFKKYKIKFINLNILNIKLLFKTRIYSAFIIINILKDLVSINKLLFKNHNSFNTYLFLRKIVGIRIYQSFIINENVKVIFDYCDRFYDNVGVASDICEIKKIGFSWSFITQERAVTRHTQDYYFVWSKYEKKLLEKSNKITKFEVCGCLFGEKNNINLNKNTLNDTFGIIDRSIGKKTSFSKKNYIKFFKQLIKITRTKNIKFKIKPKNENFKQIASKEFPEILNSNSFIIYPHDEVISVLNNCKMNISLGINSGGLISILNKKETVFIDMENNFEFIDKEFQYFLNKFNLIYEDIFYFFSNSKNINFKECFKFFDKNFSNENPKIIIENKVLNLFNTNK